jgi:shikimate kinase
MNLKLKRCPGLYLAGFMGSGKTTVGRRLADELGWYFADLDEDVEADQGDTISNIFETRGELEFRNIETAAIRKRVHSIVRGRPTVVALGGGAFAQETNIQFLQDHGITLWLDCPLEVVRARVEQARHRPLARERKRFETLFAARRPFYERADFRIPIESDDPAHTVSLIMKLPIF